MDKQREAFENWITKADILAGVGRITKYGVIIEDIDSIQVIVPKNKLCDVYLALCFKMPHHIYFNIRSFKWYEYFIIWSLKFKEK